MSRLESAETIEATVGALRHPTEHVARAVTAEERVYVMHSAECLASGIDLRECKYSIALDRGILLRAWRLFPDRPVRVFLEGGRLVPDARGAAVIDVIGDADRG